MVTVLYRIYLHTQECCVHTYIHSVPTDYMHVAVVLLRSMHITVSLPPTCAFSVVKRS